MKMNRIVNLKDNQKQVVYLSAIVIVSLFLSFSVFEASHNIIYPFDETIHLSVAKSFSEGRGFKVDYIPWFGPNLDLNELIKLYPDISIEQNGKGPIYYILLGYIYNISKNFQINIFDTAVIQNIILVNIFLILFFFFCKRKFDLDTAFFSTLVITLLGFVSWFAVRANPYPLTFVLIVLTYFFLDRKTLNYFIFGIISGLAHLTHPIGVLPLASYSLFLLMKKEIKGFLIVSLTSVLVLVPWILRNVEIVGRIGDGLAIPFNAQISEIMGLNKNPYFFKFSTFLNLDIQSNLIGIFSFNTLLFIMGFGILVIFISILNYKKPTIFTDIFDSDYKQFLVIFLFITLIAILYSIPVFGWIPYLHYFIPIIILIIPITYVALKNLVTKHSTKYNYNGKIFFIIILIIIITFSVVDTTKSIYSINHFLFNESEGHNVSTSRHFHSWIKNNIDSSSIIASDLPLVTFRETGLKSVGIPKDFKLTANQFLEYYQPNYVIFYKSTNYLNNTFPEFVSQQINTEINFNAKRNNQSVYQIHKINSLDEIIKTKIIHIEEKYSDLPPSTLFEKLTMEPDLLSEDIDTINHLISEGNQYYEEGKFDESLIIFNKLIILDILNFNNWEKSIGSLIFLQDYVETREKIQQFNIISERLSTLNAGYTNKIDPTNWAISIIDEIARKYLEKENEKIEYDSLALKKFYEGNFWFDNRLLVWIADIYERNGFNELAYLYYSLASEMYDDSSSLQKKIIDMSLQYSSLDTSPENIHHKILFSSFGDPNFLETISSLQSDAQFHEEQENYHIALGIYDNLIELDPMNLSHLYEKWIILTKQKKSTEASSVFDKITNHITLVSFSLPKEYQIELSKIIDEMKINRSIVLEETSQESMLLDYYMKILESDRWNSEVILAIAKIFEEREEYELAIRYYELAIPLEDDQEILENKVKELRNLLK